MLALIPRRKGKRMTRVLCVGAHCDDIEIGCGASVIALCASGKVRIDWAVLSGSAARKREATRSMRALVGARMRGEIHFADLSDGRFPAEYSACKEFVESLKRSAAPDIGLCHERDDRHQDHRLVNEMVWNTFRDHLVLEYEIPKWDGGLGQPNVYVPVSASQARKKVKTLLHVYRSQARRDWFTADTFLGLMRLRGVECRSPSGYAEAFYGRKLNLEFG
jgi:LmbE family N-acetylglucosaminyl deacetylase